MLFRCSSLTRKRKLVALLVLSFGCLVTVNVLYLFLAVLWVCLLFVIVVFPDHTRLLYLLLLINYLMNVPLFVGVLCLSLFCDELLIL